MARVTLYVDDALHKKMQSVDYINWSKLFQRAVVDALRLPKPKIQKLEIWYTGDISIKEITT